MRGIMKNNGVFLLNYLKKPLQYLLIVLCGAFTAISAISIFVSFGYDVWINPNYKVLLIVITVILVVSQLIIVHFYRNILCEICAMLSPILSGSLFFIYNQYVFLTIVIVFIYCLFFILHRKRKMMGISLIAVSASVAAVIALYALVVFLSTHTNEADYKTKNIIETDISPNRAHAIVVTEYTGGQAGDGFIQISYYDKNKFTDLRVVRIFSRSMTESVLTVKSSDDVIGFPSLGGETVDQSLSYSIGWEGSDEVLINGNLYAARNGQIQRQE